MEKISDYGIIGNSRSAALVSKNGSIDWLCWPCFDNPSIFCKILDLKKGGCFSISPKQSFTSSRKYWPDTNILETHFETATGKMTLLDFMPVMEEGQKSEILDAELEILRIVECTEGEFEVECNYEPRPQYGQDKINLKLISHLGLYGEIGNALLNLRTNFPLDIQQTKANGLKNLKKGEKFYFSLTFSEQAPSLIRYLGPQIEDVVLKNTKLFWEKWISKCQYEGPYLNIVKRSLLILKLMNFAPSGALIASPTTSLPEKLGGNLNWDYRYCWLRDASAVTHTWKKMGYLEEAEAFVNWLLHSTTLTRPKLKVLYDVYGKTPQKEHDIPLKGYYDSQPILIGNHAQSQNQLDVYGEVIDSVYQIFQNRLKIDRDTQKMILGFGQYVCQNWEHPDSGMWELSQIKRYTHSTLLCWVALDRLIKLIDKGLIKTDLKNLFSKTRNAIATVIDQEGWSELLKTFTSKLNGNEKDMNVILLSWYGLYAYENPKMQSTQKSLDESLYAKNGLYFRNKNVEEGAFGLCSLWMVDYLAKSGSLEKAKQIFEEFSKHGNDLGIFSEEYQAGTGETLGNFPLAFTHTGLINAAISIQESERRSL